MINILKELWYSNIRTEWSHERRANQFHDWITIPHHKELKSGTIMSILRDLAKYEKTTTQELKTTYKLKI